MTEAEFRRIEEGARLVMAPDFNDPIAATHVRFSVAMAAALGLVAVIGSIVAVIS